MFISDYYPRYFNKNYRVYVFVCANILFQAISPNFFEACRPINIYVTLYVIFHPTAFHTANFMYFSLCINFLFIKCQIVVSCSWSGSKIIRFLDRPGRQMHISCHHKCPACLIPTELPKIYHKIYCRVSGLQSRSAYCVAGIIQSRHCSSWPTRLINSRKLWVGITICRLDYINCLERLFLLTYLGICPHVSSRLPVESFSWKLVPGTFKKICRETPDLVNFGQWCLSLYTKI